MRRRGGRFSIFGRAWRSACRRSGWPRWTRVRLARPHLDLVLTHVDDRFDTGMKDAIGADAARAAAAARTARFHVPGGRSGDGVAPRAAALPAKSPGGMRRLTARRDRLAIDINIVERYQNVYPTKQQTGIELFQLVHLASAAFPRVALYFENSHRTARYRAAAGGGGGGGAGGEDREPSWWWNRRTGSGSPWNGTGAGGRGGVAGGEFVGDLAAGRRAHDSSRRRGLRRGRGWLISMANCSRPGTRRDAIELSYQSTRGPARCWTASAGRLTVDGAGERHGACRACNPSFCREASIW